jgi:hypothetical protein
MNTIAVADLDDLWCEAQIEKHLVPRKEAVPEFRVTCYTIPNRFGPVQRLRDRYPWVVFGIHGWEHTFAECRAWTQDIAEAKLDRALQMGYAPLFKPPNWILDDETEKACERLGIMLHHHETYSPGTYKLKTWPPTPWPAEISCLHSHIEWNPVTDFIETSPRFAIENLKRFEKFLTPLEAAS